MYFSKKAKKVNSHYEGNSYLLHAAALQDHMIRNTNIKFEKRKRGNFKYKKPLKWFEKPLVWSGSQNNN